MGKITYVVEYKNGKEPRPDIGMDALGGRVISAAAYNFRDRQLTHAEAGAILDAINHYDLKESCERFATSYNTLIARLKSLT
ncbi:hypothetical protein [Providencia alcalifaciens]|uniref:hypothetical protein n=1 Tax=Providencia alcalifaciens TaxID=126385 RepID=UPI000D3A95FD|nr:hypothetical protein [Providencia alcalifaciens]